MPKTYLNQVAQSACTAPFLLKPVTWLDESRLSKVVVPIGDFHASPPKKPSGYRAFQGKHLPGPCWWSFPGVAVRNRRFIRTKEKGAGEGPIASWPFTEEREGLKAELNSASGHQLKRGAQAPFPLHAVAAGWKNQGCNYLLSPLCSCSAAPQTLPRSWHSFGGRAEKQG